MVLGVTGGIASGKSSVTAMFRRLGARVVSADELAREIVKPGSPVLEQLVARFGADILAADGSLDRGALGARIFGDEGSRRALNAITHPAIARLAEERLGPLRGTGAPLVIYEAPLLFEAGAEGRVDKVLVVKIRPDLQLARLMARDGLNEEDARRRIAAQLSQEEKLARADYVIDNSGTPHETEARVRALFAELGGAMTGAGPPENSPPG
ncbi:dephospho-CoA kinase [Geoalkalibacter sp.]|uniref:dephospho-CoA kinase n=1 Tax=Geoalkalibacter sp. TaxID=3041440 RepID=UPI00272E3E7E|nr:dephospho-CoA kinase [Geoalkalibacter sp.]